MMTRGKNDLVAVAIQPRGPPRETAVRDDIPSASSHQKHIDRRAIAARNPRMAIGELVRDPIRVVGENCQRYIIGDSAQRLAIVRGRQQPALFPMAHRIPSTGVIAPPHVEPSQIFGSLRPRGYYAVYPPFYFQFGTRP